MAKALIASLLLILSLSSAFSAERIATAPITSNQRLTSNQEGIQPVSQQPIRVAVASNFYPTLQLLLNENSEWQKWVTLSSGSTGLLYAQIKNGAPFDVFLSADLERPRLLEQQALAFGRVTYAVGELVLWPAEGNAKAILGNYPGRLAIANPAVAPYGEAAMQLLHSFEMQADFHTRLLQAHNVSQAFQFIATGNAKLGIVSKAQLLMAKRKTGPNRASQTAPAQDFDKFIELPFEAYKPIKQQLVGISRTQQLQQVNAFIAWLMSDKVQAKINNLGYRTSTSESRS